MSCGSGDRLGFAGSRRPPDLGAAEATPVPCGWRGGRARTARQWTHIPALTCVRLITSGPSGEHYRSAGPRVPTLERAPGGRRGRSNGCWGGVPWSTGPLGRRDRLCGCSAVAQEVGSLMIFVGIDWAEAHHDVCILDVERPGARGRADRATGVEGVAQLHALLAEHAERAGRRRGRHRDRSRPARERTRRGRLRGPRDQPAVCGPLPGAPHDEPAPSPTGATRASWPTSSGPIATCHRPVAADSRAARGDQGPGPEPPER